MKPNQYLLYDQKGNNVITKKVLQEKISYIQPSSSFDSYKYDVFGKQKILYTLISCKINNNLQGVSNLSSSIDLGKVYRYGFNGQQKTDEIAGVGNHNTALFWEYDTRLGRRWNLDPKPNVSVSSYACFGNNPIINIDVLGDSLGGSNAKSANTLNDVIKNDVFNGKQFDKLKSLITMNSKTNNFNSINKNSFSDATKNLTGDEFILANTFKDMVNSGGTNKVEFLDGGNLSPFMSRQLGSLSYKDVLDQGGGVTFRDGISSYVAIASGSKSYNIFNNNFTNFRESHKASLGQIFVHEAFGHGTSDSWLNAIRFENVYLRVHNYAYSCNASSSGHRIHPNAYGTMMINENDNDKIAPNGYFMIKWKMDRFNNFLLHK